MNIHRAAWYGWIWVDSTRWLLSFHSSRQNHRFQDFRFTILLWTNVYIYKFTKTHEQTMADTNKPAKTKEVITKMLAESYPFHAARHYLLPLIGSTRQYCPVVCHNRKYNESRGRKELPRGNAQWGVWMDGLGIPVWFSLHPSTHPPTYPPTPRAPTVVHTHTPLIFPYIVSLLLKQQNETPTYCI